MVGRGSVADGERRGRMKGKEGNVQYKFYMRRMTVFFIHSLYGRTFTEDEQKCRKCDVIQSATVRITAIE